MREQADDLAYRVRQALLSDPRTKGSTIEVINEAGVVTLKGTAPSLREREAAEEIASQQPGVQQVSNQVSSG